MIDFLCCILVATSLVYTHQFLLDARQHIGEDEVSPGRRLGHVVVVSKHKLYWSILLQVTILYAQKNEGFNT